MIPLRLLEALSLTLHFKNAGELESIVNLAPEDRQIALYHSSAIIALIAPAMDAPKRLVLRSPGYRDIRITLDSCNYYSLRPAGFLDYAPDFEELQQLN